MAVELLLGLKILACQYIFHCVVVWQQADHHSLARLEVLEHEDTTRGRATDR